MSTIELWGSFVEMDRAATQSWYAQASPWGCDCGHCRNFLNLARKKALPTPVLDTLEALGIPPEKATYVCQIYPDGDGHLYQFSYRIAGTVRLEGPAVSRDWGEGRCCHEPYPHGAPEFPQPHFDLEFWASLPQTEEDFL